MAQVLVLLSMPEAVRMQYHDRIKAKFPELTVNVVDHHSKVEPYIDSADILMTFGPMMSERVLEKASNLKWIQALGTGVDGIADRASLGKDVIITNLHGVHGPPVSEAAFMAMLALSRQLPRSVRNQTRTSVGSFSSASIEEQDCRDLWHWGDCRGAGAQVQSIWHESCWDLVGQARCSGIRCGARA